MRTPASNLEHPVHPMLVVVPAGLWVFSLPVSSWLEIHLVRLHGEQ